MTTFLSRLATRAVGGSAAASPRVPALFEERAAGVDATLEIIDGGVVAPAQIEATREDAKRLADRRAEPMPTEPLASSVESATGARFATPFAARPHELGAPRSAISRAEHREGRKEPVEAARSELVSMSALDGERRPASSSFVVTPAVPAHAVWREPAPVAPARYEESPVRVHIGRLEVRANLQQPASELPRREALRGQGLSLTDYLRGKREGG